MAAESSLSRRIGSLLNPERNHAKAGRGRWATGAGAALSALLLGMFWIGEANVVATEADDSSDKVELSESDSEHLRAILARIDFESENFPAGLRYAGSMRQGRGPGNPLQWKEYPVPIQFEARLGGTPGKYAIPDRSHAERDRVDRRRGSMVYPRRDAVRRRRKLPGCRIAVRRPRAPRRTTAFLLYSQNFRMRALQPYTALFDSSAEFTLERGTTLTGTVVDHFGKRVRHRGHRTGRYERAYVGRFPSSSRQEDGP